MDLREVYDATPEACQVGSHINKRVRKATELFKRHSWGQKRLLDIGGGVGEITLFLQRSLSMEEVYLVDIAEASVQAASLKGVRAQRIDLNLDGLPFADNHFDAVFAGEVIEHLIDPDHTLREINRVMSKNGILVLTTPNLASWSNRLILLLGWQPLKSGTSFRWDVGRPKFLTFGETQHLRVYVPRAIRQLLEANGFRVLEVRGAPALENEAWPHPWFLRPFFLLDDILASVPSLAGTLIAAARRKE